MFLSVLCVECCSVEQGDKDWLFSPLCERDFNFFRQKIFAVSKRPEKDAKSGKFGLDEFYCMEQSVCPLLVKCGLFGVKC